MMNTVVILHFAAFIAAVSLIILVISRNPKAKLNRLCAVLIFTFAIWSLGFCIANLERFSQSAGLWVNISSIGWTSFGAAAFYFYLTLTGKNNLVNNKAMGLVFAVAIIFFIYQQFSGNMGYIAARQTDWLSASWSYSIYSYLFFVYYLVLSIACIYLGYKYGHNAKTARDRQGSETLSVTAIISVVLATTVNVILPLMHIHSVPQVGDVFIIIWEMGLVISVRRYGLMSLNPTTAAEQIITTMNDSLILVDSEGRITRVNEAARDMLGINDETLNNRSFSSIILEKEKVQELLAVKPTQSKNINHELTCITTNGRSIPVLVSVSAVRDQINAVIGYVVVARDITERKRIEQQVITLYEKERVHNEELQTEAKARALFIDILAHELRIPLTPVLSSSGMLHELMEERPDSIEKKLSVSIYRGAQTLAARLEELLDTARYSRGNFRLDLKMTDINLFVKEAAAGFRPSLEEKRQQLIVEMQPSLPRSFIDRSKLEQVLSNLISNASKYSPSHSDIILSVRKQDRDLLFEVRDCGIGIDEEDQKKIFQPYHRIEHDQKRCCGLGLGLLICKQIVEAHGGKIWVSSQPGQGSTFNFSLPCRIKAEQEE
ncbi:MAG: PAS domain S-box protein [Dehalococcoidales bacterium]|nr:PAS domain S-box protein [Dehalococcoidales bacterium]